MGKGKGKHLNKGKNPFRVRTIKLIRKKAAPSEPVPCLYMGKKYASITEAAKVTKKSRTYISKRLENL